MPTRSLLGLALLLAALGAPARGGPADVPRETGRVAVPEPSAAAIRYHRTGNVWWVVVQVWGLAVPAALLLTGTSERMRDLARRLGGRWRLTIPAYALLYIPLIALLNLPLTYYLGHVRPHAYGLSNQGLGKWASDGLIRLAFGLGMGMALLWLPYWLMRRSPRFWWFHAGLLTVPLVLLLLLLRPLVFDPMFNRFGPMRDKALEARILALAGRAGIEGSRVFEVDKSRDTKTVNAYVTGLGSSKRIVLWDTLLERLEPDEVLAVVGHELGHYVLGHVATGTLLSCLGGFIGLGFVHLSTLRILRSERLRHRFGFDRMDDVASAPLLALLVQVFVLATTPVSHAVSRTLEHEADRFALEITRDNRSCASAFAKLQRDNLSIPRPGLLNKVWRWTHPPIGERIDFSNDYRPWSQGVPGRYEHLFRGEPGGPG